MSFKKRNHRPAKYDLDILLEGIEMFQEEDNLFTTLMNNKLRIYKHELDNMDKYLANLPDAFKNAVSLINTRKIKSFPASEILSLLIQYHFIDTTAKVHDKSLFENIIKRVNEIVEKNTKA